MEEPQNPECAVMASMNLPNKARETTLLPSNEQFGGDTEGAGGDTEGVGGGGDERSWNNHTYSFIYITTCIPVVSLVSLSCSCTVTNILCSYVMLCYVVVCGHCFIATLTLL